MQSLNIKVFKSVDEAPSYSPKEYTGAELVEAAIIKNGTHGGNPTVDLIFVDNKGNKFVAMITGKLLKSITTVIGNTNEEMI